jgi:hypothetical protein
MASRLVFLANVREQQLILEPSPIVVLAPFRDATQQAIEVLSTVPGDAGLPADRAAGRLD